MQCVNEPTRLEPALIECPTCHGGGCKTCCDRGVIEITGCPKKIAASMSELPLFERFFDKGVTPDGAALLDQTAWFVDAATELSMDRNKAEAEQLERSMKR